jgi:hypothetical protein
MTVHDRCGLGRDSGCGTARATPEQERDAGKRREDRRNPDAEPRVAVVRLNDRGLD